MGLRKYKSKRDFKITPEPTGRHAASASGHSFVIQKHEARRLHYDFRLEIDGVLVSWAVPKGLPYLRGERRLAVHVEDHPLEYGGFEGIIPKGQYGGGTVMLWDEGTYSTEGDAALALKKGKIDFTLKGKKLKGDWTLVRTRGLSDKDAWLVIKRDKSMRPISKRQDDLSAASGRTMAQIAAQRDAVWQSKAASGGKKKVPKPAKRRPDGRLGKLPRAKPQFIEPMKAKLVEDLPSGNDWAYEIKFDGVRVIAVKDGSIVRLFSRNNIDRAARYSEIAEAVGLLPAGSAVLDGEIVALDEKGRSSFQLLQQSLEAGGAKSPRFAYFFDLLQLEERDLRGLALTERKELLAALIKGSGEPLRYSAHVRGKATEVLRQVKRLRLEGIVTKRMDSKYESGRRSGAWCKWKIQLRQEFVIGGYTPPRGTRPYFGALLIGYYEGKKLRFASKVGTGFTANSLKSLHRLFQTARAKQSPFAELPIGGPDGLTRAEVAACAWLKPKWVGEVKFSEWTRDGHLRHPVFLGMREDKKPKDVKRERPV